MKVDYFCAKFPYPDNYLNNDNYFCGGSIIAANELIFELQKKGVDSNVFTTSHSNQYEVLKDPHLTIHRYPTHLKVMSSNISLNMKKEVLKRKEVPDIVHTHFDLPPTPYIGYKYAKEKNIPLIITYHGDWISNYGNIFRKIAVSGINNFQVKKILDYAKIIISPSEYYINESSFLPKYSDKIEVIPNGINTEKYDINYSKLECRNILEIEPNACVILYLGALTKRKGADILIHAYSTIAKEFPDSILLIGGTGALKPELEQLISKYQLEKQVKILGYVDEDVKPLLYRASDIFCLPSTISTEVFPLVLLEAALNHLPIITSDLQTFQCFIENGKNGIFAKRGDINDLSNILTELITERKKREMLGECAYTNAKSYSWSDIADKTIKLYNRLS